MLLSDSYAETDSNTEIRKREKPERESPLDFGKSTLMDQWRQDLNYHCPTEYEDVYNKVGKLILSVLCSSIEQYAILILRIVRSGLHLISA